LENNMWLPHMKKTPERMFVCMQSGD